MMALEVEHIGKQSLFWGTNMAQRVELAIEQDTVHSTLLTSAVYYALLFLRSLYSLITQD